MKKVYNKTIIILLIISTILSGCSVKKTENKIQNQPNFESIDDEQLQEYLVETLYSGVNSNFTTDDYQVDNITTMYLSKEYIEECEFNSQETLYFGYTESELEKQFKGKKYVFTVDENNKTIVKELEKYENKLIPIANNIIAGTGVILVCATISLATGGTTAIVFAVSAKTGAEIATSSAALSGLISSSIEYYKTGDINKALEKGALDASESFKWGAILGSTTAGFSETVKQYAALNKLKTMNAIERGTYSEVRAFKKFGGKSQVSYKNGKVVSSSIKGSSRPDLVRTVNGKIEAIEVKNYDLNNQNSKNHLYRELKRQISERKLNLPKDSTQKVVLDIRGRKYSKETLKEVKRNIKKICNDVYPDLPVETMA